LGRAGLWHALRQSHIQLSHKITFLPSAFFTFSLIPSSQPDGTLTLHFPTEDLHSDYTLGSAA
jgi:hypothetical protein